MAVSIAQCVRTAFRVAMSCCRTAECRGSMDCALLAFTWGVRRGEKVRAWPAAQDRVVSRGSTSPRFRRAR